MPFFERKRQRSQNHSEATEIGHQRKISTSTVQNLSKRRIYVNIPLPTSEVDQYGEPKECYVTNKIRTSKYTLLTFLPKNLFEQFRRVANMYFLFLVVLQLFPMIGGEVQPFLAAMPLISIISMTALKDVLEDWKRHTQDKNLNRSKTTILRNWRNVNIPTNDRSRQKFLIKIWNGFSSLLGYRIGENLDNKVSYTTQNGAVWTESHWQDVKVGDIIKLKNNDAVPADMIILSTSEPDGLCFVETKNLDGETNLKVRHCVSSTNSIVTEKDCENNCFYIESEQPHSNLYSYTGALNRPNPDGTGDNIIEPISINDVLLRGCVLRNTQWAIGLVVFTGTDTKIMLNSGDTPSKRSKIEIETNFHVTMNFVILFLLCLGSAIADGIFFIQPKSSADIFEHNKSNNITAWESSFLTFWASLILFQNIVPISLYITIEVVKTVQAYFIHSDIDMYYPKLDYPCTPKTWNISDDLGQIEYIFSDKTGTLTQNVMEFRKCTINGVSYGKGETDATRGAKLLDNNENSFDEVDLEAEKQLMLEEMSKLIDNQYMSSNLTFIDSKLYCDLGAENKQSKAIQDFFSALALCHTVLVEHPDENNPYNIEYKAQSPDEAALVGCARDVGFVFIERHQDTLTIELLGERKEFTLLNVLEFNSTRKRMSVILRSPEGSVILLCKGADSVIYERLEEGRQDQLKEDTLADLEKFANEGLRTLCVAYRVIPEEEYNVWAQSYAEASSSINDREEKVEKACELIEHSLTLMGGTAIEDRLQEGVPECIATLSTAGIKIWVLTGDKTETAINIGFSCNLLQKDMLLIIINASDKQSTLYQLKEAMDKFFGPNVEACNKSSKHALVIDGETLKYALDQSLKHLLLDIGKRCNSVICCRVSPLQKAKVVALVKEGLNVMTLSIGDGANDVSMIQEANVGIGIAGEEGRQAVMAADYAFAQFRFLDKLLLVHGRWSYIRIAEMISCFFYKNIVWTIAMFWYQIWAGFTAQYLYDYTYILLYNLAFTAVPVMYLGAFDQDVDSKTSLDNPQLYKRGILQRDFTKSKFWLYVLDSFYQSAICFFIPFGVFQNGSSHANGLQNNGLSDLGTMVAGAVVVTTNLYVGLNTMNWSWLCFVVIGLSILSFYAWVEFYSLWYIGFFRMDLILYTEIDFWLTVLLCVVFSLLPRYAVKYIHKTYWPSDMDIIREQVHESKKGKNKKRESGEQFTDISLDNDDDSNRTMVVDIHDNTNMHRDVHNDNSFADITLDISTKPRSMSKLPKLPRITSIRKTRKDSIRSVEQLFHMDSGKRQSFTGFAFSGEESSFEGFRQSIYQPKQQRTTGQRSNTFTSSSNNDKEKSLMSVFRNRTMPTTLFRRWSPNPSRATSPNRSNNDENGQNVRRRGNSSNEEVELTTIPPS